MKRDTDSSKERDGGCCKRCLWEVMRCVLLLLNAIMFVSQLQYPVAVSIVSLYQVFGAMVLSTGIYLMISGNNLSSVTGTSAFSGAAVLIVGGTVVGLVALIGVMAASSLSWQLLLTVSWRVCECGVGEWVCE